MENRAAAGSDGAALRRVDRTRAQFYRAQEEFMMFEILSFSAAPTGWTNYYYDGEVLESEPMPGWLTVRYASDPANAGEVLVEPGSFAKAADPDGTWGGASVRPAASFPGYIWTTAPGEPKLRADKADSIKQLARESARANKGRT
jgi:hypothetical protein